MKTTRFVKSFTGILGSMVTLAVVTFSSTEAWASSFYGKVTFLGTTSEVYDNGYQATFRIRLSNARCDNSTVGVERWISVRSGRMDGSFAHNSANFRNAYDTLLNAFVTGKNVQIDGFANCTNGQILNLRQGYIGLY